MDSPLADQSPDPLLAFASEASEPAITPTVEREPAFLRTATPYDGHLSITSLAVQPPRTETARGWRVTTMLVVVGVLAGFAGGYAFADRIIAPAVTPAHRITGPASASAPRTAAAAPTVAPAATGESAKPSAQPLTEPARQSAVVKTAQTAEASATAERHVSTPRSRASAPSSTKRPAATTRPRPAVAPIVEHNGAGAIEIVSRPRDAQVLLDGILVGRAPLSIPDVAEGLHEVRVEFDGFKPWVGSVRVKGGSRARVGASLEQ